MIGAQFGRLTVTGPGLPYISPQGKRYRRVRCQCICGKDVDVRPVTLTTGVTQSCDCLQRDRCRGRLTKWHAARRTQHVST